MKHLTIKLVCTLALAVAASTAQAIAIRVVSNFSAGSRDIATTILADGFGTHAPPSLGAFNVALNFDLDVLTLQEVRFYNLLGEPDNTRFRRDNSGELVPTRFGSGDALTNAALLLPPEPPPGQRHLGQVQLDDVSLLSAAALDALQPSRVVLATLLFHAQDDLPNVNPGRLGYSLPLVSLSDAFGNPLRVDATVFNPLPEPSGAALGGIGMLAWLAARRTKKN